jgi:biopolymer transport protein ExbD
MAPMIDMVFLLLVFFMTVSTLAQDERRPLPLPESEQSVVPEESAGRGTISLDFSPDGGVALYLGAAEIDEAALRAAVREALARDPELEVNVRAPAEMPFREIKRVLRLCAEAGAARIVYATYQKA